MANIGIDIRMIGTKHGGIGRYIQELLPEIIKGAESHNFSLFYNSDFTLEKLFSDLSTNPKIKLIRCDIGHYSFKEQWQFANLLNKQDLDLIHFPNFNVPIRLKLPFVVTIHDMVHHKISGNKKTNLFHFLAYKKVIENAAKKARKIITVSETSKNDISNYLHVPKEKIFVTYEGSNIETSVSAEKIQEIKNKYYLRKPYFLFVGVLERKKNIINLARAFDFFIQNYKADMDMVFAGRVDPHYPRIKHSALDIKNKNRLVFTDYVSENDLPGLYAGAAAFVSASLHEGFGLPGVEAMKFGLPLLVSDTPVFNEIYDNAAVYFNALDIKDIAGSMDLITKDLKFQEQLSKNSFCRSSQFSWKKCALDTLKVYSQVLRNYEFLC